MKVIYPADGEKVYGIAAAAFVDYWQRITGELLTATPVASRELPAGDLVLIGSDAANALTHLLIKQRFVARLRLRYGTDDYQLLSVTEGSRQILLLAGGCGRSTLYAVYDFFRLRGKVEYFWDGDSFHHHGPIDIANLDHAERPHFHYRGLRYFAHRGAHRFFPEMWNLAEWQHEIDWILKRRMNLFMLRIGTDDLFQRAFDLPYPPEDGPDPDDEALPHARTALWSLARRGELRRQVLAYARDRGLLHPEDTGAMSHWYTPAPSSFFRKFPDLPMLGGERTDWYSHKKVAVWDVESDQAMQLYWQLTEAHIDAFGGGRPRLFHTIGLAERLYGDTEDENLQLKLYTLRRTQEIIRRHYPDTPMLIAGWDLAMWWKSGDVRDLLDELDPATAIVFDYNADQAGRRTFRDYGLPGRLPWIFGMLHAFAFNNEMRGDYAMLGERLVEAAGDPMCRGFLFWPELSHSDTFALDFIAEKGWRPDRLTPAELVEDFCRRRYPAHLRKSWEAIWQRALRLISLVRWGEGEWPISAFDLEFHHRLLESDQFRHLTPERLAYYQERCGQVHPQLASLVSLLDSMVAMAGLSGDDPRLCRDLIDIARAGANLSLRTMFMDYCVRLEAWRHGRQRAEDLAGAEGVIRTTFQALADLLEQNDDFSLRLTLERLSSFAPLNPAAEATLKKNASSSYCRNQTYEVVRCLYLPELEVYFEQMKAKLARDDRSPFQAIEEENGAMEAARQGISRSFMATPLAQMTFTSLQSPEELACILTTLKQEVEHYLAAASGLFT